MSNSPATTSLVVPFKLPIDANSGADFMTAQAKGELPLWEPLDQNTLDLNFLKSAIHTELLSLWGLSSIQETSAQHYFPYQVSERGLAWIFNEGVGLKIPTDLDGKSKDHECLTWLPERITALMTRRGVGVIMIKGSWELPVKRCTAKELDLICNAQFWLRQIELSRHIKDSNSKMRISTLLTTLLMGEPDVNSKLFCARKPEKHDAKMIGDKPKPFIISSAHLCSSLTDDQEALRVKLWRLRRGYNQSYISPPVSQEYDSILWPRGNQMISASYEGLLMVNRKHPESNEARDLSYAETFLKRHVMLYLHSLLEVQVIKNLNWRVLRHLKAKPIIIEGQEIDESSLLRWRGGLKELMDLMVNYSLAINTPVCSVLSDYQSMYQLIRQILYMDQLRDDLESGIKLIYEVYETDFRQREERREKEHREREERREREQREREERREKKMNIAIAALTPFVIITGVFGMNNFNSEHFNDQSVTHCWNSFHGFFYSLSVGRSLLLGLVISYFSWRWMNAERR